MAEAGHAKYRPYPAYKSSGVEWLGDIPEGWEVKRLKYVCTYNDDVLSETIQKDWELEYVDIGNVSAEDGIQVTQMMPFRQAPSRARRIVRNGDILISTVRTYLKAIAPIIDPPDNMVASTGFAVIRPTYEFQSPFASFALRLEGYINEIVARSVGVSYPAINASDLVDIYVPLPPLPEQTKIAAFLDHETAKIDALIAKQQRLIALLEEKRQAVISHAVTKGLNPTAPLRPSGIDWLGDVPEHWEVKRLKYIAGIQSGIPKGPTLQSEALISVPMLRVANVQDGYLDLDDVHEIQILPNQLERFSLQVGDVLMNEGGDNDKLGRGAVWEGQITPCIHQNHVFAIRTHFPDSNWLSVVTQASYAKFSFFRVAKQSTNLASISSTNIKEVPVVFPPKSERKDILEFVDLQKGRFDGLHDNCHKQITLLKERRTALISAAVTGKIDLRDWQPPAYATACTADISKDEFA